MKVHAVIALGLAALCACGENDARDDRHWERLDARGPTLPAYWVVGWAEGDPALDVSVRVGCYDREEGVVLDQCQVNGWEEAALGCEVLCPLGAKVYTWCSVHSEGSSMERIDYPTVDRQHACDGGSCVDWFVPALEAGEQLDAVCTVVETR